MLKKNIPNFILNGTYFSESAVFNRRINYFQQKNQLFLTEVKRKINKDTNKVISKMNSMKLVLCIFLLVLCDVIEPKMAAI